MLTGNIPEQLCGLSHLHIMDLARNNLSGSIPQCLGDLIALNSVTLLDTNSNNHMLVLDGDHMELIGSGTNEGICEDTPNCEIDRPF